MFLSEKRMKYKEKVRTKSAKMAISGIFDQKKIFLKNRTRPCFGLANTHLCAKNQKKLMMKSRENAKKPVFPAYFRHFRPEKYVFRKSCSVTFQVLPFCINVQNFMKKYKVQLRKFKKYRFSGENRLFRQFLESSGYKNQFN